MSKRKFSIIEEVNSRNLDIWIIREVEAYRMKAAMEEDEKLAISCLLDDMNDYLSFRDDLFLIKLESLYDHDNLIELLDECERIQIDIENEGKEKLLLTPDGKKYRIKVDGNEEVN